MATQPGSILSQLEIRSMQPGDDCTPFRTLNEEWITRFFSLEKADCETLGDPENRILRKGGRIFFGYMAGEAVACVALIPMGGGVYELSKMAVSPELRGLGIGRKLLMYAIEQGREMGARSLFLGSSTKLANAIGLYESVGFRHVPRELLPDLHYSRADVFMELAFEV